MTTRASRAVLIAVAAALAALVACSVPGASGPGASPPGGVLAAPTARPAPEGRRAPTRDIASPPIAEATSVPRPALLEPPPTRDPAPLPVLPPAVAIDLYREGDFVSQATKDWCVPGAIATMINLVEPVPPGASAPPDQARLNRLARSLSTDRLVGAGSEPEGWAGALNELGYGPYEVRAEPTREAALEVAARAMRLTNRPVGLLVWRGAHAWVLSGFEATADPAVTAEFDITHVLVQDPWYPRTSSIWGPGQRPNTRIAVDALAADYLPWRRPAVRYPEKDGRFVVVLPVVVPAG